MSLFPAYSETPTTSTSNLTEKTDEDTTSWLKNPSFVEIELQSDSPTKEQSNQEDGKNEDYDMTCESTTQHIKKKKKKKDKKVSKKKHKAKSKDDVTPKITDFTGEEEYYIDKKSIKGYLAVKTLHWPARPKYVLHSIPLGFSSGNKQKNKIKRYFRKLKSMANDSSDDDNNHDSNIGEKAINDEEYSSKSGEINRKLTINNKDIDLWIEYVNLQDKVPIKSTKTQLAERKMEIIQRALIHNHGNERLYKLYVEICNATYPSFEVSKMLDILLAKDPTNYVLWSAQILATQGSMARCIVPDVLKLYEECMQKMYRKSQKDEIMMKLFTNCALFLRQSGLNEQFFALLKLALELNVVDGEKFSKIQPSEADQQTIIDYEEVILKSGLPMNEIWLRIEKLRQNFYFLPLPSNTKTNYSDPQRIVFNEDICFFIYPLAQKANCFTLILIILRLLKIPFLIPSCLRNQFLFKSENLNEFDAIEEILSVYLYQSITSTKFVIKEENHDFDYTLYELIKETISGPSFLSSNIGYEIYLRTISEILLLCAECFNDDERQRTIFILIWLKFERIQIIIEKYAKRLTADAMKKIKTRIKNALKRDENRNVLNFYTEYALIEYEFGNLDIAENIFVASISASILSNDVQNSDLCFAYVTYAELLMKCRNYEKALKVLTCYTLGISLENLQDDEVLSETKKLKTLTRLTERLNDLILIEKNVQIMELEQYFLPDYFVNLLKAKTYCQILLNGKLEAMAYLEKVLRYFIEKNDRHLFVREMIFEFYVNILQTADNTKCSVSNLLIYETITRALNEYPENLFILHVCATLEGQPWYKIRRLLMKNNLPISVIFLIVSARYRCEKFLEYEMNTAYKLRVSNILSNMVDKDCPLRKNSLMWRLYLRSLCDIQASFEQSKNKLFAALDECPWNKALYLDGSILVPQELSQLQDLIIEKQLRMYALPEELEILRNDTFEIPQGVKSENENKEELNF